MPVHWPPRAQIVDRGLGGRHPRGSRGNPRCVDNHINTEIDLRFPQPLHFSSLVEIVAPGERFVPQSSAEWNHQPSRALLQTGLEPALRGRERS